MSDYYINGSECSLAPFSVNWVPIPLGIDHSGRRIISANWDVRMDFESASITWTRQWLAQASGGASVNLTTLDRWHLGYVILSSVYLNLESAPDISGENPGSFSIVVSGATPSAVDFEH